MQVTKKSVLAKYGKIVCIPYASAQHLLSFENRAAHTIGVYGWNCDVFHFSSPYCAIVTGYRPFGNVCPDLDLVRKYDRLAEDAIQNLSARESLDVVRGILARFICAAIDENNK